jgi:hypothetical protein
LLFFKEEGTVGGQASLSFLYRQAINHVYFQDKEKLTF